MIQIMAGNQKGSGAIFNLLFDNFLKANLGTGVKVGERLIQNHTFWVTHKSGHQTHFFLVPFGKVSYVFLLPQNFTIKENFKLFQPIVHLRWIEPSEFPNEIEVFLRCEIADQKSLIDKSSSMLFPILT